MQNRIDCKPFIYETLKYLYNLHRPSVTSDSIAPMIAWPRYPSEVLFAIGGWSGGSPTASIETYDIKCNMWTHVDCKDPYGPRAYHGTIVKDHCIYVIGGFDGLYYFSSCRKYDTVTKIWSEIGPMNSKRYHDLTENC